MCTFDGCKRRMTASAPTLIRAAHMLGIIRLIRISHLYCCGVGMKDVVCVEWDPDGILMRVPVDSFSLLILYILLIAIAVGALLLNIP